MELNISFFVVMILIYLLIRGTDIYIQHRKHKEINQTEVNGLLPYKPKTHFFSRSEQEFFNILNSHLDAHRHTVFPKVRLADFVEVFGMNKVNKGAFNKIKAKHVDFLIWDLVEKKLVLAIELDGQSHNSKSATKKDKFKDKLFTTVGLKLVRVKVGTNFEEESQKIAGMLK